MAKIGCCGLTVALAILAALDAPKRVCSIDISMLEAMLAKKFGRLYNYRLNGSVHIARAKKPAWYSIWGGKIYRSSATMQIVRPVGATVSYSKPNW